MIELVILGSLILLGLHILTERRARGRNAPPVPVDEPAPAVVRLPRAKRPKAPQPRDAAPAAALPEEAGRDFEILYREEDGTERSRRIAHVRPETIAGETLIHCDCAEARGVVTLKNSRILSCRNLRTGRAIKDLGRYSQSRPAKSQAPVSR
ncbi:hypothetical protein [Falsirhodobacter sp. 1013]|uniref:hypothetical protein n=1 Tax=Falsirhodobacter sp. 1013 TaxID=3417566 RepID=UPI003EBC3DE2